MKLTDLKDQRTKLLVDAQRILLDAPDTEKRASAKKMLADVDVLESDIADLERIATFETEERSRTTPDRPINTNDGAAETHANESRALSNYLKFGSIDNRFLKTANVETRDIGTVTAGSITGGSQLIPASFFPLLTEAQKTWGGLLNIVSHRQTDTGSAMKIALANDTGNSVAVVGETVAPSETDPTFSGLTSNVDFVTGGLVKITLREIQDAYWSVETFMRDNMGVRFSRGVNNLITNGSSTGNVQSILTAATLGATTASPTVVAYQDLAALYTALEPAYLPNASWVMNSTTRGELIGQVNTLGNPIFVGNPSSGAFDTLLGRPVVLNQAMPSIAATHVAVQLGDFSNYLYRTVGEPSLMTLRERFIDTGEIAVIMFATVGGILLDGGTHPVLNLACHA